MYKLLSIVLISLTALSMPAMAEFSSNMGFATKYMHRGIKQSDQDFVLSAGADYQGPWGFYAGAWGYTGAIEDLDTSEVNGYAGFAASLGTVSFGLGAIAYERGADDQIDNTEYNVNVAWNMFRLSSYQDEDNTYQYHEVAASYAFWGDGGLSFTAGVHQPEDIDEVYNFGIRYVQAMPGNVDFDVSVNRHDDKGNSFSIGMSQKFDF